MSEKIKNNQIPEEIKDICRSCEENIHCQNKGCAFRSLGNEYCDYILNATKLYLDLQQKVEQLVLENEQLRTELNTKNNIINECSDDILKELKENHHLSYGVALSIRNKLLDYKELKDSD